MTTRHTTTGSIVTRLRDALRNSFQLKILFVSLGGVLLSALLGSAIFVLGINRLTKETLTEVEYSLSSAVQQHLASEIEGTAAQINLQIGHAQADLNILADIAQQLIDNRAAFKPLTEAATHIPFFADKMQYEPSGGYAQNAPDEPTVVTVQAIYLDENGHIQPYPQQIIDETALLDLVMPAIHTQGAEKMWTYFVGDAEAGFLRLTPWTDFGKEAIANYPEEMQVSYWTYFPGLIEAWERWLEHPEAAAERPSDIVTFWPAIDATSGQTIQIFGHPLWNKARTRFAGAVWCDLDLAHITNTVESMHLAETGFAFIALGDGNVIAIPDRGIQVLGLQERAVGDGNLLRSLAESREPDVAALTLPQDDGVSFQESQLAGKSYIVATRRLAPVNVFVDGAEHTTVEHGTLGFVVPKDEVYALVNTTETHMAQNLKTNLLLQAVVIVVVIAILLASILVITRRMTRGLAHLAASAGRIARGHFDTRAESLSKDEIGDVAGAFNHMAGQLEESFAELQHRTAQLEAEVLERRQAERELQESQERLRAVVENMPVMMDAFDAEGNILVWNKECERVTGYSAAEMVGNPRALDILYPEPGYWQQMNAEVARPGYDFRNMAWTLTCKDGTRKTISWSNISARFPIPGWDTWAIGVDVTERVQAEQALRESQRQLATLMRNLPGMAYRCLNTSTWPMTFVSEGCLALTGYTPDELMNTGGPVYGDLIHPDDRQRVWDTVQAARRAGNPYVIEYRLRNRKGEERWVWEQGQAVGEDGNGIAILEGFIQDITKRKQAEAALRESEEKYRLLAETTRDIILLHDMQGRIVYVNRAGLDFAGFEPSEAIGQPIIDFIPPEYRDALADRQSQRIAGDAQPYRYEIEFVNRAGQRIPVEVHSTPVVREGKVNQILIVARDVTERRAVMQALRASEEKLRFERDRAQQYLNVASTMLLALDKDGHVSLINQKGCEILGRLEAEIIGENWFDTAIPPEHRQAVKAVFDRVLAGDLENVEYHENPVLTKSGETRLIAWHNSVLRDAAGDIIGLFSSGEDITERKAAEEALQKLNAELEERVKQRTAELARASERLELATNAAKVGIWDWDVKNDVLVWDETVYAMFGITVEDFAGNHAAFLQYLHPEDIDRVDVQIRSALEGDASYANEFRIVTSDGRIRYLRAVASISYDAHRRPERMIGVNWDITDRKRAELELQLFNEVMVGREARIIELKEEVNRLSAELGREIPYPPVWENEDVDLQ